MKALILSAGYGSRLGSLVSSRPKPMIKVGGYPVLEHLVFHLAKFGIKQIMVNLHYKPEVIMEHFEARLLYSYESALLGEEGTIDSLEHWLGDGCAVVMNGDTLTDLDIDEMFKLSAGRNVRSMDGKIYTGCKIIGPRYFKGDKKFVDYRTVNLYWQDIGTREGLKKARQHYEKISHMS